MAGRINKKKGKRMVRKSPPKESTAVVEEEGVKGKNSETKQVFLEVVTGYGVKLDQCLQEIFILANDFSGNMKKVNISGDADGVEGESLVLKLVEEVEGKVAKARSEWDIFWGKVELAVFQLSTGEGSEVWDGESVGDFSGFENSSDVVNVDSGNLGNREKKDEVAPVVDGGGNMGGNETVELMDEYNLGDSRRCDCLGGDGSGGGFNLEEGFARIERGIEEKLRKEIKRVENLVLDRRAGNYRGGAGSGSFGQENSINYSKKSVNRPNFGWDVGVRRHLGNIRKEEWEKGRYGRDSWVRGKVDNSYGDVSHTGRGGWGRWVSWNEIDQGSGDYQSYADVGVSGRGNGRIDSGVGGSGQWRNSGQWAGNWGGVQDNGSWRRDRWVSRLLSGFRVGTNVDDIAKALEKYDRDCEIVHIGTTNAQLYSSFVITYKVEDCDVFENESIWPRWVRCKEFFNSPKVIIDGRWLRRGGLGRVGW